ncbi:MAG: hypothetical protein KDC05_09325, partial [Bacteroidales bacterium]|nr:hypothetical protein [Bacteroidales bacterium]
NIEPNYFLTVLNDVTIAGTMNILSDETGTGSFLPKGALNITGTFNAERYVSGGPSHFFSAPVQGLQSNSLNGANSEKYEQSGSWASVGSTDPLSTGKGYRITTGSSQTFTLTGLPINSDVTITNLTSGGGGNGYPAGLNLIGNPFTCALDRNHESWGSQYMDASIYILSDYNYKVWNGQVGNITEGIIPAMQGFFVVVNGSNPSLTIPADARKNEFEPYYKSDEKLAEYEILRISSGDMYDEMFIQFDPSSGLNFDPGFDAYKLPGSGAAPQIYSFTNDGQKVAINCIPDNDTTYHLNLGIVVPDNALDIVIEYIRTYTYYGDLVLLDTEPFIKLDLDIDSVYHFSATPGTYNDRFKIYFTYFTGINSIEAPKVDIYFSNGFFHINSNDFLQQAEFKVYTLDGKLAGRSTFSQLKQKSIKAPVINGLVIVTLETGSLQISKKILLIR